MITSNVAKYFFFGKIYGPRHTTIHASYNSDEKLSLESLLLNKINSIHSIVREFQFRTYEGGVFNHY